MGTAAWSTRVRHDSDAEFRLWGSELNTQLAAAGLVQTADTGQVNWTTVTRAAANGSAGYEVWRFNDSLQGTAPIYIRISYGTGANAGAARMAMTVGTGTDGAGTLTGTALTSSRNIGSSAASMAVNTVRNSYACHTGGFFGLSWKNDGTTAAGDIPNSFFAVERTRDSTGAPTVKGAMVVWGNGAVSALTATQALRFAATAEAYTAQTASLVNTALGFFPQTPAASNVGTDVQAMLGFTITPRVEPIMGICGVYPGDFSMGTTFSVAMIGTTPHTYLALNTYGGPFGPINSTSTGGLKFAMLWE